MRNMLLALSLGLPVLIASGDVAAQSSPAQTAASPSSAAPMTGQMSAQQAFQEMEQMFGSVPSMFKMIPEAAVPGAWAEMKSLQLSQTTALSAKNKELIGLAVAAQIPCDYCVYFHTKAARQAGANDQEVQEAIGMAAVTRHWSTILNGTQMDQQAFRQETDRMLAHASQQAQTPAESKTAP